MVGYRRGFIRRTTRGGNIHAAVFGNHSGIFDLSGDGMKASSRHVLRALQGAGPKGITAQDFNRGTAVRSRISDLKPFYPIQKRMERNSDNSGRHARYFLS